MPSISNTAQLPIHDLRQELLPASADHGGPHWDVFRFEDHLLREVELVQVIQAATDKLDEVVARFQQNEIWVLLDGSCQFAFKDLREDSPSLHRACQLVCHEPTRIFVPAGVAFGFRVLSGPAQLIRISDTAESVVEQSTQSLPWPSEI